MTARDRYHRTLTTTEPAAASYRDAQRATDEATVMRSLEHAVAADPHFMVAVADRAALDGDPVDPHVPPITCWERHHVEIVQAALDAPARAAVLLREHEANDGPDPIAARIVGPTHDSR